MTGLIASLANRWLAPVNELAAKSTEELLDALEWCTSSAEAALLMAEVDRRNAVGVVK